MLPKVPKKPDSIRAIAEYKTFDIAKIFDLPLEVTVEEFLDCSDTTICEMAFNMQRSTHRYRVKRPKSILNKKENQAVSNVVTNFSSQPPPITAKVSEDDWMSLPLMISSWVFNQHLSKTLLDGGSLVELFSKRFIRGMKPRSAIQKDDHIRVILANDNVTTLDEYVIIPINVEEVEAVTKAWLVDTEVYDLLLGIIWMRWANCTQMLGKEKITMKGNDRKIFTVPAQIYPMEVNLPVIEFDEEIKTNEWTSDDACQELLDQQGKNLFRLISQRKIRAYVYLVWL